MSDSAGHSDPMSAKEDVGSGEGGEGQDISLAPSAPLPTSGDALPDEHLSTPLSRISLDSTPPTSLPGSPVGDTSLEHSVIDSAGIYLSPREVPSASFEPAAHGPIPPSPGVSESPIRAVPASPRTPRILTPGKNRDTLRSPSPPRQDAERGSTPHDIALPGTPRADEDAPAENGDIGTLPTELSQAEVAFHGGKTDLPEGEGLEDEAPTDAFESVSLDGESPTGPSAPLPVEGDAAAERNVDPTESAVEEAGTPAEEGGGGIKGDKTIAPPPAGEPVRRHAPPAHPHPFPIPSSSGPSSSRHSRDSARSPPDSERISPRNSTSASATPAPSASTIPSSTSPAPSTGASASAIGAGIAAPTAAPATPPPAGPAPAGGIGVKGPSAFEKVVSHTRPAYLPPKPKEEDDSHYHEWEEMMSTAKDLEVQKRKRQAAALLEKEKRLAGNTKRWDVLLSDPAWSRDKVVVDQGLRQMWFDGIPGYLRGKAWALAIGNPLAMSKDAYKMYSSRATKAYESGRFPKDTEERMEKEMDQVLPTLRLFIPGSPLRMDLKELISSWVVYRSDDGLGYSSHIAYIAAMLLLTSPPSVAFLSMCNLLSRPFLRAFFTDTKDEIDAYYRVFENLQADMFPRIYANCKNLGLQLPESYFRSLLVEQVPFEAACRLWDQIVLDGDGYIFRAALAVFGFLEPRDEIESVLEGRNRATLLITERERERAKLRGEAYEEELDGKLSVFGLNEAALFEWLETDQWKESRFERLVVREMPD